MKIKRYESMINNIKMTSKKLRCNNYEKSRAWNSKNFNFDRFSYISYHVLDDAPLATWADFSIKIGGKFYYISYYHPRMDYENRCYSVAWEKYDDSVDYINTNVFIPKYKSVGKSRKKISCYTSNNETVFDFKALKTLEDNEKRTSDFIAKCYFKRNYINNYISVSVDWDFKEPEMIEEFMQSIVSIIKGKPFEKAFNTKYEYSKEDFIAESE